MKPFLLIYKSTGDLVIQWQVTKQLRRTAIISRESLEDDAGYAIKQVILAMWELENPLKSFWQRLRRKFAKKLYL